MAEQEDVSSYTRDPSLLDGRRIILTVKSLDQKERRARLIDSRARGRLGRIEPRPVATGLLVGVELKPGVPLTVDTAFLVKPLREPRGLTRIAADRLLVSEINRVIEIDMAGSIFHEYVHPYFAFLHSLDLNMNRDRFLAVSSGYDCLIEMERTTGKVCWEWFAWEHGFSPTHDGIYLVRTQERFAALSSQGLAVKLIEPAEYGEHGLMTSQRSNHPNSACYHPHKQGFVLVTLGHSGDVIEIDMSTGNWVKVLSGLGSMPHNIMPYRDGWMVTNTLAGECWIMDEHFKVRRKVVTAALPGKPLEMQTYEWLQSVSPLDNEHFVGLDANRGLIAFNIITRQYDVLPTDEDWCIHHMVPLN
jgi:hypothetical protein